MDEEIDKIIEGRLLPVKRSKVLVITTPDNPSGLKPSWVQKQFQKPKTSLSFGTDVDETMTVFGKPVEVTDFKISIGKVES